MERILCALIGYICGLFQTSYLYGKAHGIDIRNYGSGNAGTTNALRTLGAKAGAITLLFSFSDMFYFHFHESDAEYSASVYNMQGWQARWQVRTFHKYLPDSFLQTVRSVP